MFKKEDLPYRKGVQAYIVNDNNELLLVCNIGDTNFWKIPSGGIHPGELPEETVLREMKEELGIEIEILDRCSFINRYDWPEWLVTKFDSKYRGQEQVVFIARIIGEQKIKNDPNEVKDFKWVEFHKINEMLKLEHQQLSAKRVLEEYIKIRAQKA